MMEQRGGAPVFVKIDEYKEILDILEMIKSKVKDVKETLSGINSLRSEEESEVALWNRTISEIERKIDGIDKMMFEPEHAL